MLSVINSRIIRCLALAMLLVLYIPTSSAATPASGALTESSGALTYEAGPFVVSNPTPVLLVDNGPRCSDPAQPCDNFALTVSLPDNFIESNPDALIKFTLNWQDTGTGASDYDIYIFEGAVAGTNGSLSAQAQGASTANPEVASLRVFNGSKVFTIKIVPFTATADVANIKIELDPGSGSVGNNGGAGGGPALAPAAFGQAAPTAPGQPRYQNFMPPEGSAARGSSGEANIGFNPVSGNIMLMNNAPVFRLTPPEQRTPPLPEAGPAQWTNVSPVVSSIATLDPILVTDQETGRTFMSNQTSGANILFAFSDDDGDTWIEASASPPNGGVDHQTIGTGPYPASLAGINLIYPNAVYYCAQALFPDFCQRSDDGGLSFGPGVPANTGLNGCGGLHGHVKVAPNGTVYLPDNSCGSSQGASVSRDAGITWTDSKVEDSGPAVGNDPSVAIASDGTAYFCYTSTTGAWAAVSHDDGKTWGPSVNISAQVGAKSAVFPQAVAGDPDRAACGFLGTDVPGNFQGLDFPGKWFLFIAHTYDGGQTWTTVNATPNDPVQGAGGICTGGTTCGGNRNLLDFNEVTMDDQGRVLFAYDDGCVSDACLQSGGENNDFVGHWRVARQFGGNPLLAAFDPVEPAAPEAPYLASAVQVGDTVNLRWAVPDDHGVAISSYRVFRDAVQIAVVSGDKTNFADTTIAPESSAHSYKVQADNDVGTSPFSNAVTTSTGGDPGMASGSACMLPGVLVSEDAAGDQTTLLPGHDALKVFVAEPAFSDDVDRFVISMEVDELGLQPLPPNTSYEVHFRIPNDPAMIVERVLSYDSTTGEFTFGHSETDPVTGVNSRVDDGPADVGSALDIENDRIVWVLRKDRLATLQNASALQAVSAQVWQSLVAVLLRVDDSPPGGYTVIGNDACSLADDNTPPVAVLMADPKSGVAPLTVSFDADPSFDQDDDDIVDSYTFDFGDGSTPVTQPEPVVSHAYGSVGNFRTLLTVTDSNGAQSQNDAHVDIIVQGATENATGRIRLHANNASFNGDSASYDLSLENVSDEAIAAPLRSEITEINSQSGNVTAANADNDEPAAGAFWRFDGLLHGDNELAPGEVSQARNLVFNNPDRETFSVTYSVIRGPVPAAGGDAGSNESSSAPALIKVTVDPALNLIQIELINPPLGVW